MAALSQDTKTPSAPQPLPKTPVLANIVFSIQAFLYNHITDLVFWHLRRQRRAFWDSQAPAFLKTYPVRPNLPARVHLPPDHRPGDRHPLVFLIHGGGWILGHAYQDDEQGHLLAGQGYAVVSAEYRMGTAHRFPTPLDDCAAVLAAVLDEAASVPNPPRSAGPDAPLPVDPTRVAVMGFSAGANMTLALAQRPELRHRIHAVVPVQPLTDFTGSHRPAAWRTVPWSGAEDPLRHMIPMAGWAYLPPGHDMRDPLVSPVFAARRDIPQAVMIVTSGADTTCDEAWVLARRLVGRGTTAGVEEDGKVVTVDGCWEAEGGRVRYECVPDMPHCYTHFWVRAEGEHWQVRQEDATRELWEKVVAWLYSMLKSP